MQILYTYNRSNSKTVTACSGDGGGPLACRSTLDGSWVLVGILSLIPTTCGNGALSSIFTRTSSYVTWINNKISSVSPSAVSNLTFQECTNGSTGVVYDGVARFVIYLSASLVVLIGRFMF